MRERFPDANTTRDVGSKSTQLKERIHFDIPASFCRFDLSELRQIATTIDIFDRTSDISAGDNSLELILNWSETDTLNIYFLNNENINTFMVLDHCIKNDVGESDTVLSGWVCTYKEQFGYGKASDTYEDFMGSVLTTCGFFTASPCLVSEKA